MRLATNFGNLRETGLVLEKIDAVCLQNCPFFCRVKVLASILDHFHFTEATTMTKVKKILENLLRKKSTTGHTFFKDGVEETQIGDLTL